MSSSLASVSRSNVVRIVVNPTGACLSTPSVPRKSRSPSTCTVPPRSSTPIDVATARRVTPAHAASACSNMSPEQSSVPSPPLAGCRPATARARPVSTEQLMPSAREPSARSVMTAAFGSSRYRSLIGACTARSSSRFMASTVRAVLLQTLGGAVEVVIAARVQHDHRVIRLRGSAQELVQLSLRDALVASLGVLHDEHHDECHYLHNGGQRGDV